MKANLKSQLREPMMTIDEPVSSAFFTKLATFFLWALVSLSAVGWGLRIWPLVNSSSLDLSAQSAQSVQNADAQGLKGRADFDLSVGTLLGAESKVMQTAHDLALSRLALVGLIKTGEGKGVALISLDAQNPKPYRIGSKVGDSLILSSVEERGVSFKLVGDSAATDPNSSQLTSLRLDLPKSNKNGILPSVLSAPSMASTPAVSSVSTVPLNSAPTNNTASAPMPVKSLK